MGAILIGFLIGSAISIYQESHGGSGVIHNIFIGLDYMLLAWVMSMLYSLTSKHRWFHALGVFVFAVMAVTHFYKSAVALF
ncbi:hypothetical protein A3G90_01160 [Candidatus Kaiserbacteria bacterium RIFCSPLOWO2_12_FULL_45_26]|uniref:Uncharacterized protein n=1 Tax=Candidatus Kaiserbacteria bacterium RIFCSPLOWO2_12_FULL_45_26 TaxID=1798525 RepID=A0A1F6FFP0_9BACT|nr:MAG: hypothetical protein A3G90_01160 [Candidatus Kaiserbacteria bacterium RIFCSPLOWO2_12_FULL_45_26]